MSDKTFKIAIVISVAVHLVLLGVIGTTSAAKPIQVEQLKIVRVDLAKTPDQIAVTKQDQPKPDEPKAEPDTYIPPVKQMKIDAHPPKPVPHVSQVQRIVTVRTPSGKIIRVASAKLPGDPGGALNMGTQSRNGEDMGKVVSGNTPVGWVANPNGGEGMGSGTGPGVGRPDPVPDAHPGPGREAAPEPAIRQPEPPPAPRMVEVTVCAISGDRPGPYCEHKETKSFVEGHEPTNICDKCKAPEPKYESRLADAAEAVLISEGTLILPESVRENGIDARVTLTWTIDEQGKVTNVEVTSSSGNSAVDRACVEKIKKNKYKPAVQDSIPRSVKKRQTIHIRC